jgi:hypothetical protein
MAKPKHTNTQFDPLPDLSNYDPEPADGVRVGESPEVHPLDWTVF